MSSDKEMESFLPSEIARLVLGYLEETKCLSAHELFLKTSPHLEECLKMRTEGKKFRSLVMGLSLIEILAEYSAIDSLVQEQLKKFDANTAAKLKNSGGLLDKLKVLLNAITSKKTMVFSIRVPTGKSPQKSSGSVVRKRTKSSAERRKEAADAVNEEVASCPETSEIEANQTSVETTDLTNLPGSFKSNTPSITSVDDNMATRMTKKKSCTPQKRTFSDSEVIDDQGDNLATRFTKTSEIRSPDNTSKNCKPVIDNAKNHPTQSKLDANPLNVSNALSVELDNAMKSIAHENTDTAFDNLFGDIIGPVPSEISDEYGGRSTNNQPEQETNKVTPAKHRDKPDSLETPTKIDDQNAAAIESIIQMNSLGTNHAEPKTKEDFVPKPQDVADKTGPSDIPQISVPTGTCSTAASVPYNPASTTTTKEVTSSNLVVPAIAASSVATQDSVITIPSGLVFNQPGVTPVAPPMPDNRFIVLNNAAPIAAPILIHSSQIQAVSEQDIMSMPTVILCDSRPATKFVPQPVYAAPPNIRPVIPVLRPLRLKNQKIQPCPTEASSTVANMITSEVSTAMNTRSLTAFQANDVSSKIQYKITVQQVDKLHTTSVTTAATTTSTTTATTTSIISSSTGTAATTTLAAQSTSSQLSLPPLSGTAEKPKTAEKVVEPPTKLLTPRNTRSHIRALDFSTPPKTGALAQKSSISPKQSRGWRVPKARTNLFSSPDVPSVPIATRSPMVKLSGDWDGVQGADLIFRGSNIPAENLERSTSAVLPRARPRRMAAMRLNPKYTACDSSPSPEQKKNPKKLKRSWDADLRTLLPTADECRSPPSKKIKNTRKKRQYVKQTKVIKDLNNTETEGAAIEKELADLEGSKDVPAVKTSKKKIIRKRKPAQKARKTIKRKRKVDCFEEELQSDEDKVKSMTILSPSKMNANKRTLEVKGNSGAPEKLEILPEEVTGASTPIEPKFPENTPVSAKQVLSAKRNLTPALETPNKIITFTVPATPKCGTPFLQSPFQKMYRENFGSVDICSIPTPNIPVTPNISFTPLAIECGAFETRPTDYSNSSSYYQPSDTEQSQKLENALIEECIKFETNKLIEKNKGEEPLNLTKVGAIENETISEKFEGICENLGKEAQEDSSPVKVIENLNMSISSISSSSSSCSSDSSSSSSSSSNSVDGTEPSSELNVTAINLANQTDRCRYSLRNKSKMTPQGATTALTKLPKCVQKRHKPVSNVKIIHTDLLNSLKTKLDRTKTELAVKKKRPERGRKRTANKGRSKGAKLPIPESPTEEIIPEQSEPTPIYNKEATPEKKEDVNDNDNDPFWSDEEIPHLHISSDEEPTLDIEVQPDSNILIKELKERGIHLIPKIPADVDSRNDKDMNTKDINICNDEETALKSKADSENVSQESNTAHSISDSKCFENSKDLNENDSDVNNAQLDTSNLCKNDLEFGTITFTEESAEHFHVVHDNKTACKKAYSDYNLDLLNKAISAKVYLEESNIEEDRTLTITPVNYLLDISPKRQKTSKPRRPSTPYRVPSPKQNFKPLSILYNQLVSDSSSGDDHANENKRTKLSNGPITVAMADSETDRSVHVNSNILSESSNDESPSITAQKIAPSKGNEERKRKGNVERKRTSSDNFMQYFSACSEHPPNELAEEECVVTGCEQVGPKSDADSEKKASGNDRQALLLKYGLDTFLSKVHGPSN